MGRRTWCWCLVVVLAGCAPGNPGLVVGGALAPSDDCSYEASGPRLISGVLDVAPARVSYTMKAAVFNQLINLSSSSGGMGRPPMADPNVMTIDRAEVELRDVQDNPIALAGASNPYTVPATGLIPSSDGSEAGTGIAVAQIIPPIIGEGLRGAEGSQIIAVVRFIGVTAGGAEVASAEFPWPIEICFGCLFGCQPTEEGGALCQPSCTPGQDGLTISPAVCNDPPIFAGCLAEM